MTTVIGVRFRTAGKVYYFAPGDTEFVRGESAIVETARGIEYGYVVMGNKDLEDSKIIQPLKPVLRKATEEDDRRQKENQEKERDAFRVCLEKIHRHNLDMKLIDVEYTFDRGKVLFYFTADGRVDFRALVKDLAAIFRTRIELRQVGVRDETKILGGYGVCGRPLCCHTYLAEFAPVSIKMAKEQGLSLNPTNISGVCGRLMCCLKNEEEVYEFLNSKLPSVGDLVTAPDGLKGEVVSVSVLNQKVKVIVNLEKEDEKEMREYKVSELRFKPKRKKQNGREKGNHEQGERPEKPGRSERSDKSERSERSDKSERSERSERAERPERSERAEKSERTERSERSERADRSERFEKSDRSERFEKSDRSERPERSDKSERADRSDRSESSDHNTGAEE